MQKNKITSRRGVLKTSGTALAALSGAAALGSANAVLIRDHRLLFVAENGSSGNYTATVPNEDLEALHTEGNDNVNRSGATAHIDGYVEDSWFGGYYDEYKFNGDESDIEYDADNGVDVTLEDGSKYDDP